MNEQKPARKSFFTDLPIGTKLGIGFGVLVALIFFSALVSYTSNAQATAQIKRTDALRVPAALKASQAQANLLRMLSDVRGYLALGDAAYRESYQRSAYAFEMDLATLQQYSPNLEAQDQAALQALQASYEKWKPLPEQLFELRDDQLEREPAYRMLATNGVEYAGNVIVALRQIIDQQGRREATADNLALMSDMSKFQGNFISMLSALRGYTTTRNRIYRYEYEVNRGDNDNAWERLLSQKGTMTEGQQKLLDDIAANRQAFLDMPEEIFASLEGERWREDLYLFTTEAVPLADEMDQSLSSLVQSQQATLTSELSLGRRALDLANQLIIGSGLVALVIGLLMAYMSRRTIAAPVSRLTDVAEQIRGGDLAAQAQIESRDEIGVLATTFNSMTAKLRDTLTQVRMEKKRADDLLEVVIPIGVDLTTEKDFNRLIEKVLMEAKDFCHADTGMLYMSTEGKTLEVVIARSDTRGVALGGTTGSKVEYSPLPLTLESGEENQANVVTHVALNGETLNFQGPEQARGYNLWGENGYNQEWGDYPVESMLTIPLKNNADQVLGVLQLINAQDPETARSIPFDENLEQMMESFSSLAVAALEAYTREYKLRQEIRQLRIEINEAQQRQQISEVVETDFFQNLAMRARDLRLRHQSGGGGSGSTGGGSGS